MPNDDVTSDFRSTRTLPCSYVCSVSGADVIIIVYAHQFRQVTLSAGKHSLALSVSDLLCKE